eukprot:764982-Hanusia_phi.AAC.1
MEQQEGSVTGSPSKPDAGRGGSDDPLLPLTLRAGGRERRVRERCNRSDLASAGCERGREDSRRGQGWVGCALHSSRRSSAAETGVPSSSSDQRHH